MSRGRLGALAKSCGGERSCGRRTRATGSSRSFRRRAALLSWRYRSRRSRQNERLARPGESQVGKIICALKLEKCVRDIAVGSRPEHSTSARQSRGIDANRRGCSIRQWPTCRLWRRSSRGISTGFRYIHVAAAQHAAPRAAGDSGAETASQAGTAIALPRRRSGVEVRAQCSQPLVKRRVTAPRRCRWQGVQGRVAHPPTCGSRRAPYNGGAAIIVQMRCESTDHLRRRFSTQKRISE